MPQEGATGTPGYVPEGYVPEQERQMQPSPYPGYAFPGGFQPPPGFGGPTGFMGPGGAPAPTTITQAQQPGLDPQQGEAQASASAQSESWRGMARQALINAGADPNDPRVKRILNEIEAQSEEYDRNPIKFQTILNGAVNGLMQVGAITQTPYSQSLMESGFGFQDPEFNQLPPSTLDLGPQQMIARSHALANFEGEGVDWVRNEATGWIQYKNGTLVNPNYEIGNINAVVFEPASTAPGSPRWLSETVPSWSPGKINEWRGKLIQGGYLSGDQKKGGVDANFLNAMRQYQAVRYQNNGNPMPLGPPGTGSGGVTPFNFRQLQGQIRNDIRTQWQAIYGVLPSDDEIAPLEDMVIRVSHKLYQGGQLAPQQATAEAEERMIERMQRSPEARFITSNIEENTRLHDQLLRAVQVTSAMSG